MAYLLLGGAGYVGSAFQKELAKRDKEFIPVSRKTVDYTRKEELVRLIRETKPSFLINAAGYTGKPNVDACEIYKSDCLMGNAVLPGVIREACEATQLPWGHVSSGCIFTGKQSDGSGFRETDDPNFCFRTNNCSFYSGCKALGEETLEGSEQTYIWRLRIPFSEVDSPRNYLSKLMNYDRLLQAENSISHLEDFVRCCVECWEKRVDFGTYNVTNTGYVSTREVTELIQRHLAPEKDFAFFKSEAEFMAVAAKTPRSNCVMDNSKLRDAGIEIRDVQEALTTSLKTWTSAVST